MWSPTSKDHWHLSKKKEFNSNAWFPIFFQIKYLLVFCGNSSIKKVIIIKKTDNLFPSVNIILGQLNFSWWQASKINFLIKPTNNNNNAWNIGTYTVHNIQRLLIIITPYLINNLSWLLNFNIFGPEQI